MAITTAMPLSFKAELLGGIHDMDTDVFKIALYTSAATLGASTTAYSATNETTGTGYTAGGNTLTGAAISSSGTTAWATFNNSTWSVATLTARGALIYNSSKANRAVAVGVPDYSLCRGHNNRLPGQQWPQDPLLGWHVPGLERLHPFQKGTPIHV